MLPDVQELGRVLLLAGIGLIVIGGIVLLFARMGLGRLPGDILIRRGNFTFYFPLLTGILISLIVTLILWLFRRS